MGKEVDCSRGPRAGASMSPAAATAPRSAVATAAMLITAGRSPCLFFCRLHFATNLGVAGGLLLLASFGAGRFTVDALMAKKKE